MTSNRYLSHFLRTFPRMTSLTCSTEILVIILVRIYCTNYCTTYSTDLLYGNIPGLGGLPPGSSTTDNPWHEDLNEHAGTGTT